MHSISLGLTSVTWTSMIGLVLGCFTLGLTQWAWSAAEKRFFPIDEEVSGHVRRKAGRHA